MPSAPPNIFDQSNNTDRARLMQQQYGIDPTMGAGAGSNNLDYAGLAAQSRTPGLAAQQQALGMYQGLANGTMPSLAQAQTAQQSQMNQRMAMAAAAQGRGGNLAGMQGRALNQVSGMQNSALQAGQLARLQEQQMAMQGMANLGTQMYGQGFGYNQLGTQAALGSAQNALGWYGTQRGLDLQREQMNQQNRQFLMNFGMEAGKTAIGGISGAMGGGLMSDERAKQNMAPTLGSVSAAVGQATPISYQYTDGAVRSGLGQSGTHVGFTAQDLERTPLGPQLVSDTPQGKVVNTGQAAMAGLAGVAELRQELDAMKGHQGQGVGVPATAPRGNVNLYQQPRVYNPDGSVSTVDSRSYNIGGRETLLPSVTPGGQHLQSDADILGEYHKTGRHLGQFSSVGQANRYAEQLHNDYAAGRYDRPPNYAPSPFDSNAYAPDADISFADRMAASRARQMGQGFTDAQSLPGQQRGGMQLAAYRQPSTAQPAYTINPFDEPRGSSGLAQYLGGAQPSAVVSDERMKKNIRLVSDTRELAGRPKPIPIPVRIPETARSVPIPTHARPVPQLTPEEQQLVDAANDIRDRATFVDEAGVRRARPVFLSDTDPLYVSHGERRFLADEAARERAAALDRYYQEAAAQPRKARAI